MPAESSSQADVATEDTSTLLEVRQDMFWLASEALDTFVVHLNEPNIDKALLKRLGDAPYIVGGQNLTTLLAKAYDVVDAALYKEAEAEE